MAQPLPYQKYINHLQDRLVDHHLGEEQAIQDGDEDRRYDHTVALYILNKALDAEEISIHIETTNPWRRS